MYKYIKNIEKQWLDCGLSINSSLGFYKDYNSYLLKDKPEIRITFQKEEEDIGIQLEEKGNQYLFIKRKMLDIPVFNLMGLDVIDVYKNEKEIKESTAKKYLKRIQQILKEYNESIKKEGKKRVQI